MAYIRDNQFSGHRYLSYEKEDRRNGVRDRYRGQIEMMEWMIRQNEYLRYSYNGFKTSQTLHAGDIYEVDFGLNVNTEFSYRHYALVLTDSYENNPLVLVCPLKSNIRGPHPSSDVNLGYIDDLGGEHETLAVVNQIRVIDKYRIFKKPLIGKKEDSDLERLSLNDSEDFDDEQLDNGEVIYRLDNEKFDLVMNSVIDYIKYGRLYR